MGARVYWFTSLLFLALLFANCKKEYACMCTNPGGTYTAFKVKATQDRAEKKCVDYYNENFGDVIMNETHCEIR